MTPASRRVTAVVISLSFAAHAAAAPPETPPAVTPDRPAVAPGETQVAGPTLRSRRVTFGQGGAVRFTFWPGSSTASEGTKELALQIVNEGVAQFRLLPEDTWTLRLADGSEIAAKGEFRAPVTGDRDLRLRPLEGATITLRAKRRFAGEVRAVVLQSAVVGQAIEIGSSFTFPSPRLLVPPVQPPPSPGFVSTGQVRLVLWIDADGVPARVQVRHGDPHFLPTPEQSREAVTAVSRWRFTPAIEDGVPVAALMERDIDFSVHSVVVTVPLALAEARKRVLDLVRAAYASVVALPSADGIIAVGALRDGQRGSRVAVVQFRLGAAEGGGPTWIAVGSGNYGEMEMPGEVPCSTWFMDPADSGKVADWLRTGLGVDEMAIRHYAPQEGGMVPSGDLEAPALARWNREMIRALARAALHGQRKGASAAEAAAPVATEEEFLRDMGPFADTYGNMVDPRLLKRVEPMYPRREQMARLEGTVWLRAVVERDGSVADLRVVAAPSSGFATAAADAVCYWKYAPALLEGEPVTRQFDIYVDFRLR